MNAREISACAKANPRRFSKELAREVTSEVLVSSLTRINTRNWRKIKARQKHLPYGNVRPVVALIARLEPSGLPYYDEIIDGHLFIVADEHFAETICALLDMTEAQRDAVFKQLN